MPFIAADAEKMNYLGFVISGFADVFLHAYSGYCIMEASTQIKDEAYDMNWYDCDIRNQKLILMIMKRAQKPSAIYIPFVTLSLETFVKVNMKCFQKDFPMYLNSYPLQVMQAAGSYVTLLNTFLWTL